MMATRFKAAAIVVIAIGALTNSSLLRAAPSDPIACHLISGLSKDDLTLTATLQAARTLDAHYRLSVAKRDSAGQSINIQSGAVTTTPGMPQVLATVTFPASANGHVDANLQITWDRGQASCSFP